MRDTELLSVYYLDSLGRNCRDPTGGLSVSAVWKYFAQPFLGLPYSKSEWYVFSDDVPVRTDLISLCSGRCLERGTLYLSVFFLHRGLTQLSRQMLTGPARKR